jgi:hypothetical protein
VQQGTFPRATLPHYRQHLTFTNPERQVVKERKLRAARAIDFTKSLNSENLFFIHWMHHFFSLVQIRASVARNSRDPCAQRAAPFAGRSLHPY